jgi:phosphoribosylaminoimidazole synthetase
VDYKQSGVDIEKADRLTEIIRGAVSSDNIGMFAGIYEHPYIPEYALVACTDGVGTKVIPLIEKDKIETIATDLAAMSLNDMICVGAQPMFFLDYFATNSLDVDITARFVKALKEVLAKFNCTLLGGETAELGDLVAKNHFDVGGFAVGIVKKDHILKKENVSAGDVVIGLKSSGPHSNGYSLIRKLFNVGLISPNDFALSLEPTYIYVNEILELCKDKSIKVCANITGGGILGNLERVIPNDLAAVLDKDTIPSQHIFETLLKHVEEDECYKTFNMGVGMCIIASPDKIDKVMTICEKYEPFVFGRITENDQNCRVRFG